MTSRAVVSTVGRRKERVKGPTFVPVKRANVTKAETGVTGAPSETTVSTASRVPTNKVTGTVNAGKRVFHVNSRKPDHRYTLDPHKAYLDSMASHHSFYTRTYLRDVHRSPTTMSTSCNAGQTETSTRGWYGDFEVWLNSRGIANLLSIPALEEAGYKVESHTDKDWAVTSPQGRRTVFKRDTGVCRRMPYIDLREHGEEGLAMIATVRKNFEGFTPKEIERAIGSRVLRRRVGHPSEEHFKTIVSGKNAVNFNCPYGVADADNATNFLVNMSQC